MAARILSARLPSPAQIETLVAPSLLFNQIPQDTYELLARYVALLYRWNQKMNLTAVRDPRVLVELHIAECLRASQAIPKNVESVLDFGSGAGLPGIAIKIARPDLRVTLAESQNKKASFLMQAVRELRLVDASVHSGRVEDLPATQSFDLVALRAVDKMTEALSVAVTRVRLSEAKGWCLVMTSASEAETIRAADRSAAHVANTRFPSFEWLPAEPIPATDQRVLLFGYRVR